ncbi:MAG: hypothetical protein IPH31_24690 [Lewinellaceae bacterium]|nr:hypothetical protein [Lewinellaceae bacterium]
MGVFCGSGPSIWYKCNGQWRGVEWLRTTISKAANPSVVQISANNYWMVYVSQPYSTGSNEPDFSTAFLPVVFPTDE